MRLIDADALMKRVDEVFANDEIEFKDLIDNAPTVEYTFEEAFQHSVCNNKLYCPKKLQGIWINREAVSNTTFPFWERYECSECHKYSGYSNYCPNCGADMRERSEVSE